MSLALQCGGAAKALNDIAQKYRMAQITFVTMVQNLDIMQMAWKRIEAWSIEYWMAEDKENGD